VHNFKKKWKKCPGQPEPETRTRGVTATGRFLNHLKHHEVLVGNWETLSAMNDASTPLPSAHDLVEIAREGTAFFVFFACIVAVADVIFTTTASATRLAALNGPQGYDLKLFPFAPSHEFRCWVCKQVARQAVVINGDPWYVKQSNCLFIFIFGFQF
jgi:hypothetical protein